MSNLIRDIDVNEPMNIFVYNNGLNLPDEPGHYIAIILDHENKVLNYYDSLAGKPEEILKLIIKYLSSNDAIDMKYRLKINEIKR